MNSKICVQGSPHTPCHVKLLDNDLWDRFNSIGTEMIITKNGRRMFPSIKVKISDLEPNSVYCVFLEFVPVTSYKYKYSNSGGWSPIASENTMRCCKLAYLHPDSPANGQRWMSQEISFSRVKLTNTLLPPAEQVVLSSMHKYQPQIIIAKTVNPNVESWATSMSVAFAETQFIAVTAYQNEDITKLKIENNPFAKGFRENGKSHCKRKYCMPLNTENESYPKKEKNKDIQELEIKVEVEEASTDTEAFENQRSSVDSYQSSEDSQQMQCVPWEQNKMYQPSSYYDYPNVSSFYPTYNFLRSYDYVQNLYSNYYRSPFAYGYNFPLLRREGITSNVNDQPQISQYTDFSINAILNS